MLKQSYSLSLLLVLCATTVQAIPSAPVIKASAETDCFKSLDAKDMENLGHILYLREKTVDIVYDPNKEDLENQLKLINERFTGEKREAAFAILGKKIANRNEAKIRQVMNLALYRGDSNLNEQEIQQLSDLNQTASLNDLNLRLLLNLKTASLKIHADFLKSKGAKLLPNGQWSFGQDFDFSQVPKDPNLAYAIESFFPNEMKELQKDGRGYAIIGDRVVVKEFDQKSKKIPPEWYCRSANIEKHTKKTIDIIDRFTKKAEEFARLGKENGHWIKVTDAALSGDAICGQSIKDIAIQSFPGIGPLIHHFYSKQEDGMTKWEKGLNRQLSVNKEMHDLLAELTIHGASDETKSTIREAIFDLQRKSDVEMEGGIEGMKTALTAMALSPLAFLASPIALPAAGASGVSAGIAYTGAALTVVSLATPVVIATRNIIHDVESGDGALCSIGKQMAMVPVKAVDTLKWGAMGPMIKTFSPALRSVGEFLKMGPAAEKYAVIIPGSLIAAKGIYNNAQLTLEANRAIENIEKAIIISRKENNSAHTAVLEEMLKEAKEQRWSHVLTLARSSVGILDTVRKVVEPKVIVSSAQAQQSKTSSSQVSNTGQKNNKSIQGNQHSDPTVYVGKNTNSPMGTPPASPGPAAPNTGANGMEYQAENTFVGVIKNAKSVYSNETGKQESEQKLKEKEEKTDQIMTTIKQDIKEVEKLEEEIKH